MSTYDKSWDESWAYPNVIKDELKAASYDVQPYPGSRSNLVALSGLPHF